VAKAREAAGSAEGAFCNRFALSMLLTMRSLARRSDAAERRRWRDWLLRSFPAVVDAVSDPEDRVPAFVDAVNQVVRALRHPRAYLRNAVLD
jgi:hypothetical protein